MPGTISVTYGTAVSASVPNTTTIPTKAKATYAIATKASTTTQKHAGITINETTGAISVTAEVPANSYALTVTATATEANYTGTQTADVTVVVTKQSITTLEFSYSNLTVAINEAISNKEPTAALPTAANATYSIDTRTGTTLAKHSEITIDANGAISITAAVPVGTYQLTVIATVADTVTTYTGTKAADVTITVNADIGILVLEYDALIDTPFGTAITDRAYKSTTTIPSPSAYSIATKTGATTSKHAGITISKKPVLFRCLKKCL